MTTDNSSESGQSEELSQADKDDEIRLFIKQKFTEKGEKLVFRDAVVCEEYLNGNLPFIAKRSQIRRILKEDQKRESRGLVGDFLHNMLTITRQNKNAGAKKRKPGDKIDLPKLRRELEEEIDTEFRSLEAKLRSEYDDKLAAAKHSIRQTIRAEDQKLRELVTGWITNIAKKIVMLANASGVDIGGMEGDGDEQTPDQEEA